MHIQTKETCIMHAEIFLIYERGGGGERAREREAVDWQAVWSMSENFIESTLPY